MRHAFVCALGLASLASTAGAQDQQALLNLFNDSFATAGPNRVYDFLQIAKLQGLIRNADETAVAKEFYDANSHTAGEAAGLPRLVRPAPKSTGGSVANPQGGVDVECNDTVGFADVLNLSSGSCTVTGSTGTGDLRDVYRFSLTGESLVTVSATAAATPGTLNLFDNVGRLVLVGLTQVAGTRAVSKVCLPAGTFFVNVVGTNYTLTVTAAPTVIPTLVAGANLGTVNPNGLAAEVFDVSCWKFTVAPGTHADVQLSIASVASVPDHNLFFNLGRATAGRVHFCDNVFPLPLHANDPDMTVGLPGGTYYLYVQNSVVGSTAVVPYTLTYGQTPITPPNLCGTTNYTFSRSGRRDLFCVTLGATDHVSIRTGLGTVPPTGPDSYIELFDADMGLIAHNDDGNPAGTGGLFSWLDLTLPAGTYYMTFRGFSSAGSAGEFGDYAVTGTCNQNVTVNPIGARRAEPFTIAVGSHAAFTFTACTAHPLTVAHTNNMHVVGADGKLRASYQQLVSPGSTILAGTSLAANEVVYLLNRTTSGSVSTTATLYPAGQLGIDLTPVSLTGAYQLKGEDKIGNTQYLLVSVGAAASPFSPGFPFSGALCLDLPTLTTLFFHPFTTTTTCRVNFALAPYLFPDLRPFIEPVTTPGIRFQSVTLPTLTFTNIAQ